MAKSKLTPMQRKAIDAYFRNGFVKSDACRQAGYSDSTANGNPAAVFKHPAVVAEVERRLEKQKRKYNVDEDFVIQRLARIANAGEVLATYKKVNEDGSLSWDFTDATPDDLAVITELTTDTYQDGRGEGARTVKKFKVAVSDPKSALDSLARIQGLFNDKVTVEGEVTLVERLQRGRERAGLKGAK